jgi:hypothetical protein
MTATQLYAGAFDGGFADSMAEAIEEALNDLREEKGLDPLPAGDVNRQMLFLAISRGVISHLKEREQAFKITSTVNITTPGSYTFSSYPTIDVQEP